MSRSPRGPASVERLREEFDAAFSVEVREPEEQVDLLAIRIGARPFAVRLTEIAAFARMPRIVPAPSVLPEVLGLAAVRGVVLPVYALGAILEIECTNDPEWLIVTGSPALALGFEAHDAYARLPAASVARASRTEGFVSAVATFAGDVRPVLDLGAVHARLAERAKASAARQRSDHDAR